MKWKEGRPSDSVVENPLTARQIPKSVYSEDDSVCHACSACFEIMPSISIAFMSLSMIGNNHCYFEFAPCVNNYGLK